MYQVLFMQSSAILDSPSLKMSVFFPPGIRRADLTWEFHLLLSEKRGGQSVLLAPAVSQYSFSSVASSCLTLWDPKDCCMPGFAVQLK